MKVLKTSYQARSGPLYEFQIEDATGKTVWSGTGFVSPMYREDAIKTALRALTGQPPVIAGKNMTDATRAILRSWSDERFGTHAG